MIHNLQNFTYNLNKNTADYVEAFSNLDKGKLNSKINPEVWSIAEIIEHLILTNDSYTEILSRLKHNRLKPPFTAKFPFLVKLFGNIILKSVLPSNKRKVKTFPVWKPAVSELGEGILKKFEESQNKLIDQIKNHKSSLLSDPVIYSPANKFIVYRFSKALEIIIEHQKRHFIQASEIKSAISE